VINLTDSIPVIRDKFNRQHSSYLW